MPPRQCHCRIICSEEWVRKTLAFERAPVVWDLPNSGTRNTPENGSGQLLETLTKGFSMLSSFLFSGTHGLFAADTNGLFWEVGNLLRVLLSP